MPTHSSWYPLGRWSFLAAVLGLAFWLRLAQIGESLWLDELHTSWVVADGGRQLVSRAAVGNQSPVYFALVWSFTRLAGANEFWLRLPSVLAGVALAVGVYWAMVRWTASPSAGLLAALLVAVDRNCVFYGQEARPYALVQLAGLVHVGIFAGVVRWTTGAANETDGPDGSQASYGTKGPAGIPVLAESRGSEKCRLALRVAWIGTGVLLFYLHYTAVLLVAAEVVVYGLSRFFLADAPGFRTDSAGRAVVRDDSAGYRWRQLGLDLTLLAACLLPAVPHLREIAQRRQNWLSFVPARSPWRIWEIGDLFPLHVYLLAPLAVLAASWAYRRIRGSRRALAAGCRGPDVRWFLLALCWVLVPLTLAWGATVWGLAPLFFRRYLIVTAVAPILWAALCCAACPAGVWRGGCVLVVVSAAVHHGGMIQQWRQDGRVLGDRNQDWRSAVAYLNEHAEAASPVFVRSGLIEAEHWYGSEDPLRREFCLLPVLGLYRLDRPQQQLFPLPLSPPAVLTREARRRVLTCREAWCLVHGNGHSQARFEASLRSVWPRAGVPLSSVQRRSFGDLAVLRIRTASGNSPATESKPGFSEKAGLLASLPPRAVAVTPSPFHSPRAGHGAAPR